MVKKEVTYDAHKFGGNKEVELIRKFDLQLEDSRTYFKSCIKPRLDRAYKLYIADNSDRAREIQRWQANVFVPYIHGVVETLMPRILDARPEFAVQGRTEEDQLKSEKVGQLADYTWEVAEMDDVSEDVTRSSLVYGTGFMQVSWKKDVRKQKFLSSKDLLDKKLNWKEEERVFYDAPFCEWVDNYSLWYDWHNVPRQSKQYWFKRLIMNGAEIKRRYPGADPRRMNAALSRPGGDLEDYGSVRNRVKLNHEKIIKGADYNQLTAGMENSKFQQTADEDMSFYEVFEWWRPFEDAYAVMVNGVPILKGGSMPIPFDFKETPFIDIPYLKLPGEFEGVGLPLLLENPQIMLNLIKNQRLDAATLNIHKMWIVNPLANVDRKELVTRPFGIIYSHDPQGVREVQFSDVKASAYREEELIKGDMRYTSGVDDFSMGVGGGAGSATEVRHLRESTLERVRLFVNHLGTGYAKMLRYWISMYRQFFTDEMTIRVIGEDGRELFPLIERDDLKGEFDFKALVIPSIAGKNDIDKKQGMDLFQLLAQMPFVDPKKLTSKVLQSWNWSLDSIAKQEEPQPMMPGMPGAEEGMMQPGMEQAGGPMQQLRGGQLPMMSGGGQLPPEVIQQAIGMLGGGKPSGSPFSELGSPVNLLNTGNLPPTAAPLKGGGSANRGGKVNTNLPLKKTMGESTEANMANRANNIQR